MKRLSTAELIKQIQESDPALAKEVLNRSKEIKARTNEGFRPLIENAGGVPIGLDTGLETFSPERITEAIVMAHHRPVMIIRNNQLVPEFDGPDSLIWKERLMGKKELLNKYIPSVGRIEVKNNPQYSWVGTGWLVDEDIIVTNRHVAFIFAQNKEGFRFRQGHPSGFQIPSLDFLEEHNRNSSFDVAIDSVLWMSPNETDAPDIAFLRIKRNGSERKFPGLVPLATTLKKQDTVVTIGYPADDPSVKDRELVKRLFGNIFDKKRLSPGEIMDVSASEFTHNCTTFGGNSGSLVLSLSSEEAVGLHFAGLFMRANYAVPAPVVAEYLHNTKKRKLPGMLKKEENQSPADANVPAPGASPANADNPAKKNTFTFELNIPVKITVELGDLSAIAGNIAAGINSAASSKIPAATTGADAFDLALAEARNKLLGKPGIVKVESSFSFRKNWIQDEKVIAVIVSDVELMSKNQSLIPPDFNGISVEIRMASVRDQLKAKGLVLPETEAVPRQAGYLEPEGFELVRYTDQKMKAIFHVSPDAGWPCLSAFFSRVKKNLTGTMYEWESEHISKALKDAFSGRGKKLTMVTQKKGTAEAADQMAGWLKSKFSHTWASTGAKGIVPTSYHIKVSSRDGEEIWLSSGNWKNSNQADIDPVKDKEKRITPLREKNREWHAIIAHKGLAETFQKFIEWDFEEANRLPTAEAPGFEDIDLIITEAPRPESEARAVAKYFKPKTINRVIDIEPLLTPDRDDRGRHLFIKAATELIRNAKKTIDIENQSFTLLKENDEEYERFFTELVKIQNEGKVTIRIIYRDAHDYPGNADETIFDQLTMLRNFGFDTRNFKLQPKCHTKAIIVDSGEQNGAAVLFGSHNFTNSGALFNRDASLLVRDKEVAEYFQEIFNFDWEVLASQYVTETPVVSIARAGEEAPPGTRKMKLSEFLSDD